MVESQELRWEAQVFLSSSSSCLDWFAYTVSISPLLQTKLKSAVQLQDLLDATRMLVPRSRYQKHVLRLTLFDWSNLIYSQNILLFLWCIFMWATFNVNTENPHAIFLLTKAFEGDFVLSHWSFLRNKIACFIYYCCKSCFTVEIW